MTKILDFFRLCGPCSVVVSDRGDAGKGDSFYIPPKNYCNLIDQKVSDGEVEELLLHEFERLEVEKVVEGYFQRDLATS